MSTWRYWSTSSEGEPWPFSNRLSCSSWFCGAILSRPHWSGQPSTRQASDVPGVPCARASHQRHLPCWNHATSAAGEPTFLRASFIGSKSSAQAILTHHFASQKKQSLRRIIFFSCDAKKRTKFFVLDVSLTVLRQKWGDEPSTSLKFDNCAHTGQLLLLTDLACMLLFQAAETSRSNQSTAFSGCLRQLRAELVYQIWASAACCWQARPREIFSPTEPRERRKPTAIQWILSHWAEGMNEPCSVLGSARPPWLTDSSHTSADFDEVNRCYIYSNTPRRSGGSDERRELLNRNAKRWWKVDPPSKPTLRREGTITHPKLAPHCTRILAG